MKRKPRSTRTTPLSEGLTAQQLAELDACTECGECLRHCPVQQVRDDPSISPPEKIRHYREFIRATEGLRARIVRGETRDRVLLEHFTKALYECTTCGACGQACTVGIDTQRLWPALRRKMVEQGLGPIGAQARMPDIIRRTGNVYDKPAEERFRPWFPEKVEVVERAPIGYYAGCTGAYEAQPMVRGDALVLGAAGEPFTMLPPEEEVCCGFPLFITGQHEMLGELVHRLVAGYRQRGVRTLVCSCPCCVAMMAREWPLFLGKTLPFRIRHITQFAAEAIGDGRLTIRGSVNEKVIYHDPCYLSRGVGVTEEPRRVLRSIPGVEVLEFEHNRADSRCCGAGGAARKVSHETAAALARLTPYEAVDKRADRLILSCPACYVKVNEAMADYDRKIRITDIMELLGENV